jgi:centrin-1
VLSCTVSKDTKEETMKVFKLFNGGADGGKITLANLKTVAKELGESMTDEELQDMIDHADKSSTNAVSFDDFYRLMAKRNAPQSAIDDLLGDDD